MTNMNTGMVLDTVHTQTVIKRRAPPSNSVVYICSYIRTYVRTYVRGVVYVHVMAKRLARKVARLRKYAAQFRFTSTLEYIDISCYGTW